MIVQKKDMHQVKWNYNETHFRKSVFCKSASANISCQILIRLSYISDLLKGVMFRKLSLNISDSTNIKFQGWRRRKLKISLDVTKLCYMTSDFKTHTAVFDTETLSALGLTLKVCIRGGALGMTSALHK